MQSILLLDQQSSQLPVREKRLYALIAVFFISLFLPGMPVVNNVAIGLLLLYSFFFNSFSDKLKLLKQRPAVAGMILFFIIHVISAGLSDNSKEGFEIVVKRLPLLFFPIALGTISIGSLLKKRIYVLFVVVLALAALACTIYSTVIFIKNNDAAWLYNDALTVAIQWQSSYVALLVTIGLFISIYLFQTDSWPLPKAICWTITGFLLIFHYLLASRIGITILYSGLILYALYLIFGNTKMRKTGILILSSFVLVALILFTAFPKTFNRFRELEYRNYNYSSNAIESHYGMEVKEGQWNGANIRLAVWQCGLDLAQRNLMFGTGLGDKMDDLLGVYKEKGFEMAVQTRRNLHSNYLDVMVAFGFTGLIVFLLSWLVLPFINCLRNRDFLGACIITVISIGCISETYFDRSQGNIMIGFLIPFIISYKWPDNRPQ